MVFKFSYRFGYSLILLVIVSVLSVLGWAWLQPSKQSIQPIQLTMQAECDLLIETCYTSNQDGMQVAVQLIDFKKPLAPFRIRVQIQGYTADIVTAQLSMENMVMGYSAQSLNYESIPQYWSASLILPICTSGRSDWQLLLTIDHYQIALPFVVQA